MISNDDLRSLIKEAKKYKRRWDFGKNNGSAYAAALRNNWLEKIFSN